MPHLSSTSSHKLCLSTCKRQWTPPSLLVRVLFIYLWLLRWAPPIFHSIQLHSSSIKHVIFPIPLMLCTTYGRHALKYCVLEYGMIGKSTDYTNSTITNDERVWNSVLDDWFHPGGKEEEWWPLPSNTSLQDWCTTFDRVVESLTFSKIPLSLSLEHV